MQAEHRRGTELSLQGSGKVGTPVPHKLGVSRKELECRDRSGGGSELGLGRDCRFQFPQLNKPLFLLFLLYSLSKVMDPSPCVPPEHLEPHSTGEF